MKDYQPKIAQIFIQEFIGRRSLLQKEKNSIFSKLLTNFVFYKEKFREKGKKI